MDRVATKEYELLIDGKWRPAEGGQCFEVENPTTGETVARTTMPTSGSE